MTIVRFLFAADRRVFHLFADEPGQLAMARWISGGSRWTMLDHNTWRPGYALVLAPLARWFDGGEALVRAALTLNAVLAGVTAVLLTRLVQRWTGLPVGTCAAVAAATALAPTAIAASAYTWSESLITLVLVTTLWLLQRFVDGERLADAVAAVVVSAFAMTTHGRAASLLVTTTIVGVIVLAHRRRDAAALVALAAGLALASQRVTEWVHHAVWDDVNGANSTGAVIERLDAPVALLDSTAGQVWYQLVASAGLVGVGFVTVLVDAVRPGDRLDRRSAAVLLASTLPPIALSITFMSDRARPDQLVYGRYLDTVVWPYTALGLALLVRRLRHRRPAGSGEGRTTILLVAGATVLTGLVVAGRHGDHLVDDIGLRMMVPGLLPYVGRNDGIPVVTITVIAVAALALLSIVTTRPAAAAVSRRRVGTLAVVVVVLLTTCAVRVHDALAIRLNSWEMAGSADRLNDLVPDGAPIGLISDGASRTERLQTQRERFQVYQLYLPDHDVVWERDPSRLSTTWVIAPFGDPDLVAAGAEMVWRDPEKSIGLWRLPDARS